MRLRRVSARLVFLNTALLATVLAVITVLAATVLTVGPAAAEKPVDVLESATNGVYVAPGRDFDAEGLGRVVDQASAEGVTLLIAAPADPQPNASAYALRLRQLAEFDAVLVFGIDDGPPRGSVSDDYFDGFARAEKAAAAAPDPVSASDAFFAELMEEPPGGLPDIVNDVVRWVLILTVVVVVASAAEMAIRSRRRKVTDSSAPSAQV